jgi:CheY-like chemotaxis protein
MVYGFAQQSNGSIQLQSEVGKGTRAELWIPRAEDEPVAKPPRNIQVDEINGTRLTVLLVDDHEEVRLATAHMFQDLGHEVVEASNGADALQLLRERGVDLLVSDYAMPQLSGTDLVRDARAHKPDLTALIITGYADADDIGDLPTDVIVLPKPFDLPALSAAVAEATRVRSSATN